MKLVSRFTNREACSSATGATSPAARPSARKKRSRPVRGSDRFRATGSRSDSSGTNSSMARLRSWPRPAKPPPKPSSELREPTRALSSNMLNRSVSSTTSGRAWRNGMVAPGLRPARPAPGYDLDVLEAEGRTRAHQQRRVGRQRLDVLVELHRDLRVGRAVLLLARLDVGDEADAGTADADLEALHQLRGVGEVRLEVVGGHEGEARVGVVAQEDGDDRDQHGHRSHQHRAGGERGSSRAARAHSPSPSR